MHTCSVPPARLCPCCANEAGSRARAPSGVCSVPIDEKLDLLARFFPAALVCLPGLGGCGLSSVVSVQDFGFSRDVSSSHGMRVCYMCIKI